MFVQKKAQFVVTMTTFLSFSNNYLVFLFQEMILLMLKSKKKKINETRVKHVSFFLFIVIFDTYCLRKLKKKLQNITDQQNIPNY